MALPHHVPIKHKRTTLERAEKFISTDYFTDVNLQSKLYTVKLPLTEIGHYVAPERTTYQKAVQATFTPTAVGESFGPLWSTHWFEVTVAIPETWVGEEVHFMWNSGSEALIWIDGKPCQGLNEMKEKNYFILSEKVDREKLKFKVHVEMACNGVFGVGFGSIGRCIKEEDTRTFTLSQVEIGLFDRDASNLIRDLESLHDIAKHFGESQRGYQALYTVNNMLNLLTSRDKSMWPRCKEMAAEFFSQKNGESQHTLYAMGHAHIDSAWLWSYAETIRKCARSWSCSLRLMERYPDFIFCCSQAQQYAWVKSHYPSLWKDICKFVTKGQFVPVGGSWVEMDGNIPSGEACIRQFLYGQKFFKEEFGVQCKEFWLPDTFGYSAQFPQLMQHCGITRFLSQKLSWSLVNKFPHHTFKWEGIDGSSVLAHFPPGDSYEMNGKVEELLKSVNNFSDKGRSNRSAFLFGHGDGGHGPSEEMLARLARFKDCDGLPRVKMSNPDDFFTSIEKEEMNMLCRWRGELYLELHNGTYTTWAEVKKANRKCEILLQEIEAMSTIASVYCYRFDYPYNELDRLWKILLLNQFHDVLPGSSISQVFKDAMKNYQEIFTTGEKLLTTALFIDETDFYRKVVVNTQSFERTEVVQFDREYQPSTKRRKTSLQDFALVKIPPLSACFVDECRADYNNSKVKCNRDNYGNYHLSNDMITAVIDPKGRVTSLRCVGSEKEAIDANHPANQFVLYDDIPLFWDAWDVMDYHLETRKPLWETIQCVIDDETSNHLHRTLKFTSKISDESFIEQNIILDHGSPYLHFNTQVEWKESHKFLKVEFPTTVHAMSASYDIQSGFHTRPNHFNTSWDSARFEVCGHKWADISEYGFGVSVLNDCKYGYSTMDGVIRLSLLRSPKSPDPTADMGTHTFSYALMPHVGTFQEAKVNQYAMAFNAPLRTFTNPCSPLVEKSIPFFTSSTSQVLIQTIKMAANRSRAVILRLNEAHGGRVRAEISSCKKFTNVTVINGLEEMIEDKDLGLEVQMTDLKFDISLNLKPFQIVSLMCVL